jgi:hypothetical protein
MIGTCARPPQKHHTAETVLEKDMDRASFKKHCELFVSGKWFNCNDLWKDFPALFDHLQLQIIPSSAGPNNAEFEETLNHGESYSRLVTPANLSAIKMSLFIT